MLETGRVRAALAGGLQRHRRLLWSLHSLYALLFGAAVMWLGARNFTYLRIAFFHIAFIWATSLLMPALLDRQGRASRWNHWTRLAINYFNKNFYQQLLFFVLPIYYLSATPGSANVLFVGFLALSAVLSTLDLVYDRHLAVRRGLSAVFFAFNLFACINVMLPVLWSLSNAKALRVSAALALVGFVTIRFRLTDLRRAGAWALIAASAALLAITLEWGRAFIPPAPLRLMGADFGPALQSRPLGVPAPVASLPAVWSGRIYVLTAIRAPLGLRDRVAHRWYLDGEAIYVSPFYDVTGGRREGFRLWTYATIRHVAPGGAVRVDVVTEAGQLIGRSQLPVRPGP